MTDAKYSTRVAWFVGIVAVAIPAAIGLKVDDLRPWLGVYVGGGFGGLVLELLASRWQWELPKLHKRSQVDTSDTDDSFGLQEEAFGNPIGPRIDIGFFGRFLTGGMGAFAILVIAASFVTKASDVDSVLYWAWALAIGFASPAAWRAIRSMAEARVGKIEKKYIARLNQDKERHHQHKKAAAVVTKKAQETANVLRNRHQRQRQLVAPVVVRRADLHEALREASETEQRGPEAAKDWARTKVDELALTDAVETADEESASFNQLTGALDVLNAQLDS
jgi:hypothetical protein